MDYSTKLEEIKLKAKNDPFFFIKEVLGYKDLQEQPHRELCNFLSSWEKRKKLILLPRGTFKSTIATVGMTLHSLCHDPNLRILLATETFANATMYLREIKEHLQNNENLKLLYGPMVSSDPGDWTANAIRISQRSKLGGKEPSIQVTSLGNDKTGIHADYIILDDLVSNGNTLTKEQTEKTVSYYKYLLSIADPGAKIIVIGTRYTYGDLYAYIQENEQANFDILIRGCTKDNTYDFTENNLFFPKRLTSAFLEEQRKSQGSWVFSTQYMNQCVDADSQVFKEEWLQYYETPPENLNYFITIDPAATANRTSDFTAVIVLGVDWTGNIYVIENHQLKETPMEWMDLVFRKCMEYGIGTREGCVSLETNSWQKIYKDAFTTEMEKRRFWFPIIESQPTISTRSKEQRISALVPAFEQGKIYLKKNQYSLIDQILRFPKGKNDDQLDALKDILQVYYPPNRPPEISLLDRSKHLTHNEREVYREIENITKQRFVKRTRRV